MKTATVRDLRNRFARTSKWLEQGETVEITKRGRPVADLVPSVGKGRKTLLGCTPSPYALPADIDAPVESGGRR
jgi:prevent-host-death family protein